MDKIYIKPSVKCISSTIGYVGFFLWLKSRQEIITDLNKVHFMKDAVLTENWYDELPSKFIVGSELVEKNSYYDRVDRMNLQYNNAEYMILEINGSCLFRDILYNINRIAQWAESNRFLFSILGEEARFDSRNYKISEEYKGIKEWEDQFDEYMEAIKLDPIVDHNRLEMPYSISSKFWIGINRSTLIALLSFLKYEAPFFYKVYGKLMMDCSDIDLMHLSNGIPPVISQYIRKGDDKEGTTNINGFYVVNSQMSLILYSQFIRQSDTITSGLYNLIRHESIEEFSHKVFKGSTTFMITHVSHESKLNKTVSNRLCAFAMSSGTGPESWSHFIDNFLPKDLTSLEFIKYLPCKFHQESNGKLRLINCKFHDDIKFRNEGKEISNCPCPLVTRSMDDAIAKLIRDKSNQISSYFYHLTRKLINGGLVRFKGHYWTSDLIIDSDSQLTVTEVERIDSFLTGYSEAYKDPTILPSDLLLNYHKYALTQNTEDEWTDYTCMLKGWAIDQLRSILDPNHDSYIINFGGDIYINNAHTEVRLDGFPMTMTFNGTYSIFTSGNTSKRGNHIIGGKPGYQVTVIKNWFADPNRISNLELDILATKSVSNEVDLISSIDYKYTEAPLYIKLDNGKLVNKIYCASPFFDDDQVQIRDAMINRLVNPFRPDLTESSKLYESDSTRVSEVVLDNISGILNSEFIVFPKSTKDLGTLFEVGYALGSQINVITYDEVKDWYTLHTSILFDDINKPDFRKSYIFDCSTKSGAISMGYAAAIMKDDSKLSYELKGSKDNIMISTNYDHYEMIDGEYVLQPKRDINERDE